MKQCNRLGIIRKYGTAWKYIEEMREEEKKEEKEQIKLTKWTRQ